MKKNETETVSATELADLLGVTRKTIAAWATAGIVSRARHGRYELRASVRGFSRHMHERDRGGDAAAMTSVAQQRSRLLGLQADRVQIELDRSLSEWIPRAEVGRQWARRFLTIRNALLAFPTSLSYLDREAVVRLDADVRELLNDIGDGRFDIKDDPDAK